jgi:hypothetical protein
MAVRHWIESFVWIVCTILVWSYLWMFSYPLPTPDGMLIPSWDVPQITRQSIYSAPTFHPPPAVDLWSSLHFLDSQLDCLTGARDKPDFGDIEYVPNTMPSNVRHIPHHDNKLYNQYRQDLLNKWTNTPTGRWQDAFSIMTTNCKTICRGDVIATIGNPNSIRLAIPSKRTA